MKAGRLACYIAQMPDGTRIAVWARSKWRASAKAFRMRGQRPVSVDATPRDRRVGLGAVLTDGCEVDADGRMR